LFVEPRIIQHLTDHSIPIYVYSEHGEATEARMGQPLPRPRTRRLVVGCGRAFPERMADSHALGPEHQ
jgi:hypothetical protein